MLLSSITKNIKDQNWLAGVLDFVNVIAASVITLRTTSWNEARQQNMLTKQALKAMKDKLAISLLFMQLGVGQ